MEKWPCFRAATAGLGSIGLKGRGSAWEKGGNCDQTLKELWLS